MRLPPAGDLMLACVCVLNCVWRQFRTKPCHVTTAGATIVKPSLQRAEDRYFFGGYMQLFVPTYHKTTYTMGEPVFE